MSGALPARHIMVSTGCHPLLSQRMNHSCAVVADAAANPAVCFVELALDTGLVPDRASSVGELAPHQAALARPRALERDGLALKEAPHRSVADDHAVLPQFIPKLFNRQIRPRCAPGSNPAPLLAASGGRHPSASLHSCPLRGNTLAQILRIGLRHPVLASFPR